MKISEKFQIPTFSPIFYKKEWIKNGNSLSSKIQRTRRSLTFLKKFQIPTFSPIFYKKEWIKNGNSLSSKIQRTRHVKSILIDFIFEFFENLRVLSPSEEKKNSHFFPYFYKKESKKEEKVEIPKNKTSIIHPHYCRFS